MGIVDFILNLAALLLWVNWRSVKFDPLNKRTPATLIGTLRRAAPQRFQRWHLLAVVGALLILRALFYWQIGSAAGWTGKLDLGIATFFFRSNIFSQTFLFSVFSFARFLGIFYLWLLLLSILSGPDPIRRFVRIQLGRVDGWMWQAKLLLPFFATGLIWGLASWPFPWLHPKVLSPSTRIEEALVIGLGSYLAWQFIAAVLLALYLLNSYIYFGKQPFWNYVGVTAERLLLPLKKIPLRAGKADFAPIVGIVLVFLLAELARRGLMLLYRWLLLF